MLNPSAVKGIISPTKQPTQWTTPIQSPNLCHGVYNCNSTLHGESHPIPEATTICPSGRSSSSPLWSWFYTAQAEPRVKCPLLYTMHTGSGTENPFEKRLYTMHAGEGQTTPLRKDSTACTLSQERRLYTTHTGSATRYDLLKELHNIHNFSQSADHLGRKGVKHKAPSVPLMNLSKKVRLSPPYKKRLHTRANTTKMENTRSQSNIAVKKSTLAQDKNTSTPNTHSRRNQLYTTQKVSTFCW